MKQHLLIITLFLAGVTISAIHPHDYFTWFLEVLPALIGFSILIITYKRFQFSNFTYWVILIHCFILFIGGHYTYAEVPLFNWIKEIFHQSRNNYDKIGHFAQGFIPAIIVRELLIRLEVVKKHGWLAFLTLTTCVFISVIYEFLEWGVANFSGESADSFLGTQGYVWDTQSDMLYATIGATVMIITLSRYHNNQISLKLKR